MKKTKLTPVRGSDEWFAKETKKYEDQYNNMLKINKKEEEWIKTGIPPKYFNKRIAKIEDLLSKQYLTRAEIKRMLLGVEIVTGWKIYDLWEAAFMGQRENETDLEMFYRMRNLETARQLFSGTLRNEEELKILIAKEKEQSNSKGIKIEHYHDEEISYESLVALAFDASTPDHLSKQYQTVLEDAKKMEAETGCSWDRFIFRIDQKTQEANTFFD